MLTNVLSIFDTHQRLIVPRSIQTLLWCDLLILASTHIKFYLFKAKHELIFKLIFHSNGGNYLQTWREDEGDKM